MIAACLKYCRILARHLCAFFRDIATKRVSTYYERSHLRCDYYIRTILYLVCDVALAPTTLPSIFPSGGGRERTARFFVFDWPREIAALPPLKTSLWEEQGGGEKKGKGTEHASNKRRKKVSWSPDVEREGRTSSSYGRVFVSGGASAKKTACKTTLGLQQQIKSNYYRVYYRIDT